MNSTHGFNHPPLYLFTDDRPVYLCEHLFQQPDPQHPRYSMTKIDLYPAAGSGDAAYAVRRNRTQNTYELFDITGSDRYTDTAVLYDGPLPAVVWRTNQLETEATGGSELKYGHESDGQCPADIYDDVLRDDEWR